MCFQEKVWEVQALHLVDGTLGTKRMQSPRLLEE